MKKYELTKETKNVLGVTLYRIRALRDIPRFYVSKGDLGGWVESEENLSQEGDAWVSGNAEIYGNARVSGNARVFSNAWVFGNAEVSGNAHVYGKAWVFGKAQVFGNAWVFDDAWVFGDAWVSGKAQVFGNARVYGKARVFSNARVYGNAQVSSSIPMAIRSDGYTFIVVPTEDGPRIIAGCRYFTFDEAIEHWTLTRGGTQLGDESLQIVEHLNSMSKIMGIE